MIHPSGPSITRAPNTLPIAPSPRSRAARSVRAGVLTLLTLAALAGCQSPFQQDNYGRNSSLYTESILVRALTDGSIQDMPGNAPTVNRGVREMTRIDSAGSGAITPTAAGDMAVTPAQPDPQPTTGVAATNPGPDTPKVFDTLGAARLAEAENTISLSLHDALARALRHSLSIKAESYNPAIKEALTTAALAAFDTSFIAQSNWADTDEPMPLNGATNGTNWGTNAGFKKLLPSGATAQFGVGDTYRNFADPGYLPFGSPTSSHQAIINLQFTQPLLRGFGENVTQANIYLAQKDQRISLTQFRRQVIKNMADIEEGYHNLVLARMIVDIQERLYNDTYMTWFRIWQRRLVDADLISQTQAYSAVQARQAELIRAKTNVRDTSDKLKALINDPELDIGSNILIVPTDRPVDAPLAFSVPQQIAIALAQRSELQEARLQVEKADIVIDVARNGLLPKADLTLTTQSNGQLDQGLDRAFNTTLNSTRLIDYSAGLKIEIPLGNRAAEAELRRRSGERRQALTQMLLVAQQVVLDVKLQLRDLLTSYQEIQAREAARVAAGRELGAINDKEALEKLSPEFLQLKLDAQQSLANAEILEAQALASYNLAIMHFEQAKGTLLEFNRIAIGPAPTQQDAGKLRFLGKSYDINK